MDTVELKEQSVLHQMLLQAIHSNDQAHVATLLTSNIDIECNNNQALKLACELGHTRIVKELVESGANLHQNNNEALLLAIKNRHAEVIAFLLNQGADFQESHHDLLTELTNQPPKKEAFSALLSLGESKLQSLDLLTQLDNALSTQNNTLAKVLAHALPKQDWDSAMLMALEHGHSDIAKLILGFEPDFSQNQEDEFHAQVVWNTWYKCERSLLPLLVEHGVSIEDALYSYSSQASHGLEANCPEFVTALIDVSNYETNAVKQAAFIALEYGFNQLAQETIQRLADYPDELNELFSFALSCKAENVYPLLMSLNAIPAVRDYSDEDSLSYFIYNCKDKRLIAYLLIHISSFRVPYIDSLLDKAAKEKDWGWAEQLMYLGIEPSWDNGAPPTEVLNIFDRVQQDSRGKFAFYLSQADKGIKRAAMIVAEMYSEGIGVEKSLDQAAYWRNKANN